MMGWWNHGWGLGSWEMILIGGLMMLLFWGGLFTLLFFVIRATTGRSGTSNAGGSEDEANRILDKRYAQGEIDAEEYQQMKNDLKT